MLAWPGEEIRLRREAGANTAGGYTGKTGACWRDPAKKKGFAGRPAPTRPPAIREKPEHVGGPGEEIRLRRKDGANAAGDRRL